MTETEAQRWLVALDIDGTLMTHRGQVQPGVVEGVRAVAERDHEVMLATGRSWTDTHPVLVDLNVWPEYVVCSNGAVLMKRDALADNGYARHQVKTFNPAQALKLIRDHLPAGCYAVEDEKGDYYYTEPLPGVDPSSLHYKVEFEHLLTLNATRVVVVSPDHDAEEFLKVVERVGLQRVTYAIGWAAWLDIAPEGVSKATALEAVRESLGFPRSHLFAAGDGDNDVQMLQWAGELGRGVAMGNASDYVKSHATEVTGSVDDNGIVTALAQLP